LTISASTSPPLLSNSESILLGSVSGDDDEPEPPLKLGRSGQSYVAWNSALEGRDLENRQDSDSPQPTIFLKAVQAEGKKPSKTSMLNSSQQYTNAVITKLDKFLGDAKEFNSEVEGSSFPLMFKMLTMGVEKETASTLWSSIASKFASSTSNFEDPSFVYAPIHLVNGNQDLIDRFNVDLMENWAVGVIKIFVHPLGGVDHIYFYFNNEAERMFCLQEFSPSWKKNGGLINSNSNVAIWSRFVQDEDWKNLLNLSMDSLAKLSESSTTAPCQSIIRCVDDQQEELKAALRISIRNSGKEISFTFMPIHM